MDVLYDLFQNPFLLTGISSWAIAQVLKVIIHTIVYREFDIYRLFGDGGMPSGHSATVSSLALIAGLRCGADSFEFAISALMAIIVCHDASGVRLETGKQAVVINELVRLFEKKPGDHDLQADLKELVGHTPLQVIVGVVIGCLNALVMHFLVLT